MDGSVPRETTSGVLGIGLGLALIVGAFFVLVRMAERDADGEALLAEAFVVGELPFDFEILEARTLTTGERVVVLGPPAEAGSSDRGDGERAPPERLFLVRHSEAAIEGVIERQFRRVSYGDSVREPGKQVDLPLAGKEALWQEANELCGATALHHADERTAAEAPALGLELVDEVRVDDGFGRGRSE